MRKYAAINARSRSLARRRQQGIPDRGTGFCERNSGLTGAGQRTALAIGLGLIVVAGALCHGSAPVSAASKIAFTSKEQAFAQGLSAYRAQAYEIAVPALKYAAERGVLRAKYYLARVYGDDSSALTDHARSYGLLKEIVSRYAHADPTDYRIAPYAAKALTSMARYERDGIRQIGLEADTGRALTLFDHAATHFNDPDAQFELAKHYLAGDGVKARVPYALNWLARLTRRAHAGAQAFLANIYWDGRYIVRDPVTALALVTVAVDNSPPEDRFWIEDLHQNIFCESGQETRNGVKVRIKQWRQRFTVETRNVGLVPTMPETALGELSGETRRICANGDIVGDLDGVESSPPDAAGEITTAGTSAGTPVKGPENQLLGSAAGAATGVAARLSRALAADTGESEADEARRDRNRSQEAKQERERARGAANAAVPAPSGARARLNGFSMRETDAAETSSRAASKPEVPTYSRRPESGIDADERRRNERRRRLNGFSTMRGSSSFGFSVAPEQ